MTIKQQVENILAASSQARNSDKELEIIYMYKIGMNLTSEQIAKFREMPSMETIRRCRQQIQMEGKYPPKPEVEKQRFAKFVAMKQSAGHDVEEVLEDMPRSQQLKLNGGV